MRESGVSTGVYARIAVRPPSSCILRQLSEKYTILQFRPGSAGEYHPQVIIENPPETNISISESVKIEEIVRLGKQAIYQLRYPDERRQDPDPRLLSCYGFDFLPVVPFRFGFHDSWIDIHVATDEYAQLRDTVSCLRERTFDIDLKQVIQSDQYKTSLAQSQQATSAVDLSSLTSRQREVATVALKNGYFSDKGEKTSKIASELDISKPALSAHLRTVIQKTLSQLFP